MKKIRIVEIELPEDKTIDNYVEINALQYQDRLILVRNAMEERKLDFLVIYGDREHFANLHYVTGYDPRFEESILVIPKRGTPYLLVGNEGLGYKDVAKLPVEIVLFQTFGLMGQPRDKSDSLESVLKDTGIEKGSKVGLVGTKYFREKEFCSPQYSIDVPSFITDVVRSLAGYENVVNQTDIFMHPERGLRTFLNAEDIAAFESASCIVYSGVRRLLLGLREGISEYEAAALLAYAGFPPLSCHITVGFGKNALLGLSSPSPFRKLELGEYINFGFGVWGANIARAGLATEDEKHFPSSASNILQELYFPYFEMMTRWYESLEIGTDGRSVYNAVKEFVENPDNGVSLNPGHLIHNDEWLNSPFYEGSQDVLHSGMAIQCDIISAPKSPLFGVHVEDGLVLADEQLRNELRKKFPNTSARFDSRRDFMKQKLGIEISDEVLPMSDIQACLAPFMMSPGKVLAWI